MIAAVLSATGGAVGAGWPAGGRGTPSAWVAAEPLPAAPAMCGDWPRWRLKRFFAAGASAARSRVNAAQTRTRVVLRDESILWPSFIVPISPLWPTTHGVPRPLIFVLILNPA